MSALGPHIILAFIAAVLFHGAVRRVDCFEAFAEGAKRGFETCLRLMPTLCGMLVAVNVLQHSGILNLLITALTPVATFFGLPSEVLPLAIVRPFSGSAAMGVLLGILTQHGPDSPIGLCACIIMGSSETIFYTAGIYYGSVGVKHWRHTLPLCLLGMLTSLLMASVLT